MGAALILGLGASLIVALLTIVALLSQRKHERSILRVVTASRDLALVAIKARDERIRELSRD